ncbi:MAG: AAA family ATPase [Anaerolineae bacterium]|nr:AAA family ATPase [Anaerolineae bacterium]
MQSTANWPIIGHEWAVAQFGKSLANGRLRHAYLVTGPASVGKTTLVRALAQALNCTSAPAARPCGECRSCKLIARGVHPDVPIIEAEEAGGRLKIEQIRDLQTTLALRPVEARYRVPMILRFHEATPAAQDALLKTLEEPPSYVVLLLTAERADGLLETIVSRCQPVTLRPLALEQTAGVLRAHFGVPGDRADLLARLSGGRLGWAVRAAQDPDMLAGRDEALDRLEELLRAGRIARFQYAETLAKDKPALLEMLSLWQTYWRDVALLASGSRVPIVNADRAESLRRVAGRVGADAAGRALEAVCRTADYLARNVNTRLAVEVLMLDLPGM